MTTNYVNEIEKQGIKYGGYYMRIQKKNIVKLLSILLTVLLLLGSVVTVSADEKTDADPEGEIRETVVYLDTEKGSDKNDGLSAEKPLKTLEAVKAYFEKLAEEKQQTEKQEKIQESD